MCSRAQLWVLWPVQLRTEGNGTRFTYIMEIKLSEFIRSLNNRTESLRLNPLADRLSAIEDRLEEAETLLRAIRSEAEEGYPFHSAIDKYFEKRKNG